MGANVAVGAAFAAVTAYALHYSPAFRPWMQYSVPARLTADVCGVLAILGGLRIATDAETTKIAFQIAAATGAATLAAYITDHVQRLPAQRMVDRGFEYRTSPHP